MGDAAWACSCNAEKAVEVWAFGLFCARKVTLDMHVILNMKKCRTEKGMVVSVKGEWVVDDS